MEMTLIIAGAIVAYFLVGIAVALVAIKLVRRDGYGPMDVDYAFGSVAALLWPAFVGTGLLVLLFWLPAKALGHVFRVLLGDD